ncbi:PqqD family protein [Pseudoflavonifractor capillosus]|uniref:PqqD family protein n=1 Tax=Pseudoflavonifractor capillosus TaxID=106588 RepID=UPI00195B52F7|nr:PqqD family protein [Pseudoflavonifractor capillosus]MBM6896269.1 PqqD family protein [Pseudoflavonifractor capillosus]
MKIKNGFMLYEVAGSYVVVPAGNETLDFNGMVTLNETGAFLWKQLEQACTQEQLVQALLQEYEVSQEKAQESVEQFLGELQSNGFVQ